MASRIRTDLRLVWLLAACCVLAPSAVVAAQARSVLVIFSSNRVLPASVEVDRGFRQAIADLANVQVTVFEEYLDRTAFPEREFEQIFATYLRAKYLDRPLAAVVVAGQPAFDFMLRHRAGLLPEVPLVHLAVDKSYLQTIGPLPTDVVGVPVEYEFAGTIQQALRWHPQVRRLVVVTGASVGDREFASQLRAELSRIELAQPVEWLTALPTAAVLARLGELSTTDLVFTPGYFRDGAGRMFAPREAAELMAVASGAPVYGPFSTFIGTGVVGGRMPTYLEMGRQAAKAVNDLLVGTAPGALNLPEHIAAQVQIDWRQAQRWNIAADAIPADAVVHFRQPTFWETYRTQALIVAAVIALQAGLIAALLVQRSLRRRTAAALLESEQRMSLAARAARLSVWSWDSRRDKLQVGTPLRPPGRSSAPIRFKQLLDTVHPEDRERFELATDRAVNQGGELDMEYRMVDTAGEVRWLAVRGRAENGDVRRLTGVALDITARKAADLQAAQDRAALTHMSRVSVTAQLSASIAHQLNQPLAAILGNAEVACKMLAREPVDLAELRAICTDIVTEDHRAAEIIRRLGALYRRGEMELLPLDLNALVQETLGLVQVELANRHVVIATDLDPTLPKVDGCRIQLQQVMLNLALNAADAMSDIESPMRVLTVRTALKGDKVQLCVADRGTGISPHDIERVFDAFWTTKANGIGVGLAVCRSIVEGHRGTLTVENNAHGGAIFCANWPLRQQP